MSKCILCFALFLLIVNFSGNINAQNRKKILKQIELPVYEVTVAKVTSTLDSVVLKYQKTDSLSNRPFLYILNIKKDPDNDLYLISINCIPSFAIKDTSDFFGVFYIRDAPFIITKGCNPKSNFGDNQNDTHFLFKDTSSKRIIQYYGTDPPLTSYVDPQKWTFFYAYKGISYIEMPEQLLDRMGFVVCE